MSRNPLEVLGLNHQLVGSLTPGQLMLVVQAQHRALQNIYHPDKGGNDEVSARLNEANDLLKNPNRVREWRKEYLENSKPNKLREKNEQLEYRFDETLAVHYLPLIYSLALQTRTRYCDIWDLARTPLWVRRPNLSQHGDLGQRQLINEFEVDLEKKRKLKGRLKFHRLYQYTVIKGRLVSRDYERREQVQDCFLLGSISDEEVQRSTAGQYNSAWRYLKALRQQLGRPDSLVLTSSEQTAEGKIRCRGSGMEVPRQVMEQVLYLLRPTPQPYSLLISVRALGGQPVFFVEGRIPKRQDPTVNSLIQYWLEKGFRVPISQFIFSTGA